MDKNLRRLSSFYGVLSKLDTGLLIPVPVLWIVHVVALSDYDHQQIADACPGLFAFMLADAVYLAPTMIVMALAVSILVLCYHFDKDALVARNNVALVLISFLMYVLKIHFISTSWYSDTCAAATSGRIDPKTFNGGRPLEIVGWIQISISSVFLPVRTAKMILSALLAEKKTAFGARLPPLRVPMCAAA